LSLRSSFKTSYSEKSLLQPQLRGRQQRWFHQARTAEAAGVGPLAAESLTVEMAPVQAKTTKAVSAEPMPVEKAPDQVDNADIDGSEIEQ